MLPRILDDVWEPPPGPRRSRPAFVALAGVVVVVGSVVLWSLRRGGAEPLGAPLAPGASAHVRIIGLLPRGTDDDAAWAPVSQPELSRPAPSTRAAPARPASPGFLSISSSPWAELSVDGRLVGNTPQLKVRVRPGRHELVLARNGFAPLRTWVTVASGQTVRIGGLTLQQVAR